LSQSAAHERAYAVIFSFHDAVEGRGFFARVLARGRALMAFEDDEGWWLYGVEPGAIAAPGATPREAYSAFRQAFTKVLFDFSSDAESYEEFAYRVREFFQATDTQEELRWQVALEQFRTGKLEPEESIASLPRWKAEQGYNVDVERLDAKRTFTPDANQVDEYALPARRCRLNPRGIVRPNPHFRYSRDARRVRSRA